MHMNENEDEKRKRNDIVKNVFFKLCLPTLVALGVWLFVRCRYQINSPLSVLLNLEGTLLLAFAISFPQVRGQSKNFRA